MASQITFDILARDRASATFDKVGRHTDALGGRIGKFGKFVGAAAVSGVAALGALGVAGGVMGVKVAAGNEQAMIAFTTMLGSAQKAKAFIKELSVFAAKTPFDMPGLQQAASSLISAGIDAKKVIPIMTTLGDVTSGMGTGAEGIQRATIALQQMNAAQKISGEDLNQLRDAGIPVYDLLAKATGKSKAEVVKLAQAGKLGKKELDQMMKALESGKGLERFAGLMDKQSRSLTGLWSTFKDTIGMGLAKAVEPLIPLLKDGLGGATAFLAAGLEKVGKFLYVFLGAITGNSEIGEFEGGLRKVNDITLNVYYTLQRLTKWVRGDLIPALSTAGRTIMPMVKAGLDSIRKSTGDAHVSWKAVGDFITRTLIPVLTKIAVFAIPLMVNQTKIGIAVFKSLWATGKTLATVLTASFRVIWSVFSTVVGAIVNGAARAFGWVPGLGPKLRGAASEFNTFRDNVNNALNHTKSNYSLRVITPGMRAAINDLATLRQQILNIPRSVTVGVMNKLAGQRAAGGPITAGRTYLVGERGPELVTPSRNSYVHPNGSSVGGDFSVTVPLVLQVDGNTLHQSLLRVKRRKGNVSLGLA